MTLDDFKKVCMESETGFVALVNAGKHNPFPSNQGWPKSELLCVNADGNSVWRYPADRLLAALERKLAKLDNIHQNAGAKSGIPLPLEQNGTKGRDL